MFGDTKKELREEVEHYRNLWTKASRESADLRSKVWDLEYQLEEERRYFRDTMSNIGQAFVRVGEGSGMIVSTYEYEEDN